MRVPWGMRTRHIVIPKGDAGTRAVLRQMRRLAREGSVDPVVRDTALDITDGIDGRDGEEQAKAIRQWLAWNVAFQRDPTDNELLYTPQRAISILRTRGAPLKLDCDDVAVLAAALGGAVGLRRRFVVVGFLSPGAPMRHVWTELLPPGSTEWVETDITRSQQHLPSMSSVSRTWLFKV